MISGNAGRAPQPAPGMLRRTPRSILSAGLTGRAAAGRKV